MFGRRKDRDEVRAELMEDAKDVIHRVLEGQGSNIAEILVRERLKSLGAIPIADVEMLSATSLERLAMFRAFVASGVDVDKAAELAMKVR